MSGYMCLKCNDEGDEVWTTEHNCTQPTQDPNNNICKCRGMPWRCPIDKHREIYQEMKLATYNFAQDPKSKCDHEIEYGQEPGDNFPRLVESVYRKLTEATPPKENNNE